MPKKKLAFQGCWRFLSLRLGAFFVVLLVLTAFVVGYLFDRGRAEAVRKRELEHLRSHAERGADELQRLVEQLRGDVLYLAGTPPVQGIRRALEANGFDRVGGTDLRQWQTRLQQIFLSIAEARPEYFRLSLIGFGNNGQELVRVERTEKGPRAGSTARLEPESETSYFRETSRLEPGSVYLSRIALERQHGRADVPRRPTLRAATPIRDPSGNLFGLVVVNMDMSIAFERAVPFRTAPESVYVVDEQGDFLLHPQPGRAFASELGSPYRLSDAFPEHQKRISEALSGTDTFIELTEPQGKVVAYFTERAWDSHDPDRRLIFILTEPVEQVDLFESALRTESLLATGSLISLAIALVVFMACRMTRSLRELARASQAIGAGDFRIALPKHGGSEVDNLVQAFRHMAKGLRAREATLGELNRELERRVSERTAELTREHSLKEIILENIADGIVVADRGGRCLLWNTKAKELVGVGADQMVPDLWPCHLAAFQDEAGKPFPAEESPLIRAIQGESSDNVELYLHNPKRKEGRWAQVTARPLLDKDGDITGGVAVLVDITEQKRLRRRIESDRTELATVARLALCAGIASSAAHRISQPIAAMSNYASAAVRLQKQQRLAETELLDILTRIETCALQAGERLDELRALIRRRNQPGVPIDVNQVADSCLNFLRDPIERLGLEVDRRFGRALPQPRGNPIELAHVLIQLVSNALEALEGIEPASRRLLIATSQGIEQGVVMIEVADSGPGVPPDLAEHLFAPLPTDKPDALGVGLYIAKTIIDTYKGRIRVEKGELGGAVFCVELPVGAEATA